MAGAKMDEEYSHLLSFRRDSCRVKSASLLFATADISVSFISLAASAALVDVPDACEDSRADCRDLTAMSRNRAEKVKERKETGE